MIQQSVLICAVVSGAVAAACGAPASARHPNVLLLAVDDLNDWTGFLQGHPQARTPNLDRLAARGVVFANAQCVSPICNPSRVALLTGKQPFNTGVYDIPQYFRDSPMLKDWVTLPEYFRQQGYRTYQAGKIHHHFDRDSLWLDPQAWDEVAPQVHKINPGVPHSGKQLPARHQHGIEGLVDNFDWGPTEQRDEDCFDYRNAYWTVQNLKKEHQQPFFMAYGTLLPHLPWRAPQKYFDMFPLDEIILPEVLESDLDDVPPLARKFALQQGPFRRDRGYGVRDIHAEIVAAGQWRQAVQAYLACMTFADRCIGMVLDALDASPYRDNTVIVLFGDHGWHLGEKRHWEKSTLWEESARAPLIIAAPGVAPGRCSRPVSFIDVYPTLTRLCGLPARNDLDGFSLQPLLNSPGAAWEHPAITTYRKGNYAVRTEQYRYIRYTDGTEELYDHSRDPNEWTNLAQNPEYEPVKAELRAKLPAASAADVPVSNIHSDRFRYDFDRLHPSMNQSGQQ